jgi:hypothetical protein
VDRSSIAHADFQDLLFVSERPHYLHLISVAGLVNKGGQIMAALFFLTWSSKRRSCLAQCSDFSILFLILH